MSATTDPANLSTVFKAYDVRGRSPTRSTRSSPAPSGNAFVAGDRSRRTGRVVVGHDMRPSSPGMARAFAEGAAAAGADVTMIGLASTDQLYFASGHLGVPGAMFTASHNPAQYNGIKLCRAFAGAGRAGHRARRDPRPGRRRRPADVGRATGHGRRARRPRRLRRPPARARPGHRPAAQGRGRRGQRHGRAHRPRGARPARPRRRPALLRARRHLPEPRGEPDRAGEPARPAGRGPRARRRHRAGVRRRRRPLLRRRRARRVGEPERAHRADRRPRAGEGAGRHRHPQPDHQPAVPEIVTERGGVPVRTRVGHSFIKATMAETDAVFGGEHSGHFYFRDFWRADSGHARRAARAGRAGGADAAR